MKNRYILSCLLASNMLTWNAAHAATAITGAGATFPYPVYARWAELYHQKTGVQVNYQPIGSGAGIRQIQAGTVDFGGSDKPLSATELTNSGLMQFPTILGAVVPIVNLTDIKANQLKLTGPVLADIYQGKIKNWSDPAIGQLNPGVKLPDQTITVVHRSDGSGTSYLFTNYLAKVSKDWAQTIGNDVSVSWPVGVGGKGNEGVALYVKQISGSIGYVEFSYVISNHLSAVQMKNKANAFVEASMDSIKSAASFADWNNPAEVLTDEPGEKSWPISGASYILMHTKATNADQSKAILAFFNWAYQNGEPAATALEYVVLPSSVIEQIHQSWTQQIKDSHNQPIWP